jgi:hypothetical protein
MQLKVQPEQAGDLDIVETPPIQTGAYGARLVKIRHSEHMRFRVYQSEEHTYEPGVEFVFGVIDRASGQPVLQRAWPMKLKFSPRAKLMKFLTQYLNRTPETGFDLLSLEGTGVLVKVNLRTNAAGDKQYSVIESVRPVVDEFGTDHSDKVPDLNLFPEVPNIEPVEQAEPAPAQPAPQPAKPRTLDDVQFNPFTGEEEVDF